MSSCNRQLMIVSMLMFSQFSSGQDLEEIEVIGRQVNLIGIASSASEGRISHNELQMRPLLRTGEILESVPGLVATQHSGSGKANQFFLRGFNLDHGTDFSTFIDSMPINMRSHGHGQGYTDLNFIIPELVEEIRFRKGSYFADAGDFSAAGSANITTAEHLQPMTLAVGVGEYGFGRLLVSGSQENQFGDFIYGIENQRYDGPWRDVQEDVGKTNIWLKQRWQSEDTSASLLFMAYDNSWNSADQIPARAVASGLISEFGSIDPTVGGESSRYSLSGNWRRENAQSILDIGVYAIDYDMELFSNFSYFTSPQGDQFQQVDDRRILGGHLDWSLNSQLGSLLMTNTFGTQLRSDDIDEVGIRSSSQRQIIGDTRLDAVKEKSAGIYWQNELHWTSKLRSKIGLRHDYYDFDVQAIAAADPVSLIPNSGAASDTITTGSLSVIYAPSDHNEIYASIGQGFHSNDARGVTSTIDPVSAEALAPADPLVDSLGSEIGLRVFVTDRLNLSAALWQLDIDSELIFVGDAGNTEDTGRGSERNGLEVTGYYQINPSWSLDAEYAWSDSRYRHEENGIDDIPGALNNVFSGGISMNLDDRFQASLRIRHFENYPLDEGKRADGSTLVNMRLMYNVNSQLSITADVLNLFDSTDHDVEYFYESQLRAESAPVADFHYHVFEPRSLRVYATYRF